MNSVLCLFSERCASFRQVERKRAEREEAFRRMELESVLLEDEDYAAATSSENDSEREQNQERVTQESLLDVSVDELFGVLESVVPGHADKRAAASKVLLGHLHRYRDQAGLSRSAEDALVRKFSGMEEEEAMLQAFSLQELYSLSKGNHGGLFSDYLVYRSRQLLDAMLSQYV